MIRFTQTERIVRPRHEGGSDWGNDRLVLARRSHQGRIVTELWWWRGSMVWSGLGSQTYHESRLILATNPYTRGCAPSERSERTLHQGGRLSCGLLARYASAIDEAFGAGTSERLDPKRTLLVEEAER